MLNEVTIAGTYCNLRCKYCYEKHELRTYNLITEEQFPELFKFVKGDMLLLFGGEPLLYPIELMDKLCSYLLSHGIKNIGIQSNGVLVNDQHIQLFKKYNVSVGISIDGPDELNDLRTHYKEQLTRLLTQRTIENIYKLLDNGINVGLIITLHKYNLSTDEQIDKLLTFLHNLSLRGVKSLRLHTLELQDDSDKQYLLTPVEYAKLVIAINEKLLELGSQMQIDIIRDIYNLLLADDNNVTCIFTGCNVTNTSSALTVNLEGRYNCGRTDKYGKFTRSDSTALFRLLLLVDTEQNKGGCKDCKYLPLCKGGCPSQGLNFDFRNRDKYCELYKILFEYVEQLLLKLRIIPITYSSNYSDIYNTFINRARQNTVFYVHTTKQKGRC